MTSSSSPRIQQSKAAVTSLNRVSVHNRTKTLGGEFRGQMEELMANINTTSPHYIRCLKPNSNNVGNEFDSPLIVSQLRCGGVLEAVRVSRAGYSKRFPFHDFFRRYCFYVDVRCPTTAVPQSFFSQKGSQDLAARIAHRALHEEDPSSAFEPSDDALGMTDDLLLMGIQVGKTSVFFRSNTFDFLERQKLLYHRSQAVMIQSNARKYNAVTAYRRMKGAARVVQVATRMFLGKRRAYLLKTGMSILLLQRVARGFLTRLITQKMFRGFRRLQSVCRAGAERRRTRALWRHYRAALVIQCFARRRWAVRRMKQLKVDAKSVEKVIFLKYTSFFLSV
jgi:myosin-5